MLKAWALSIGLRAEGLEPRANKVALPLFINMAKAII